ncbi:MAG: DUF305 domain-containing protein [Thermoanaerobaculia bacterium]
MKDSSGAGRHSGAHGKETNGKHYRKLLVMTAISFLAMYALMYAMVNRFADVYPSFNQTYMAGLMAASMIPIEILVMRGMYSNARLNAIFLAGGVLALAAFWFLIRQQTAIGDEQFVKSMIPHHSGAILMCNESQLRDPELRTLCGEIVEAQQQEIDQMKTILRRLEK